MLTTFITVLLNTYTYIYIYIKPCCTPWANTVLCQLFLNLKKNQGGGIFLCADLPESQKKTLLFEKQIQNKKCATVCDGELLDAFAISGRTYRKLETMETMGRSDARGTGERRGQFTAAFPTFLVFSTCNSYYRLFIFSKELSDTDVNYKEN